MRFWGAQVTPNLQIKNYVLKVHNIGHKKCFKLNIIKFGQQVWSVSQFEYATRESVQYAKNGPKMGVFGENDPLNVERCDCVREKGLLSLETRRLSH